VLKNRLTFGPGPSLQFQKIKLSGFKSFVDASEFRIDPGLTGIVGPNGCGKSNLLEALRWVMGATSAKAMRGAGMDDVIFAGSDKRPSRNWAEVTLTIDNADRLAPQPFTDQPCWKWRAASTAARGPAIASMARRCARATCSFCSPTPAQAPTRPPSCGRGRFPS
jgi:energy-coupling factor transporter ATP-binding protein EcfA2